MGFLSRTTPLSQYNVVGDLPPSDHAGFIADGLSRLPFRPIDGTLDDSSAGWVTVHDHTISDFSLPARFWYDGRALFTLRVDQRKIPASLFRYYLSAAEQEFLTAHPGLRRVPKKKRDDLKDAVRLALLAKTLPAPSTVDLLWDTDRRTLSLTTLSPRVAEWVEKSFRRSFPDLRLVPVTPYHRALSLLPEPRSSRFAHLNRAGGESLLDVIRSNVWIGEEFQLWLLYRTAEGKSSYTTCVPGPQGDGFPFSAWLDTRIVLQTATDDGPQKVTVTGFQQTLAEPLSALRRGKTIQESAISFEAGDLWKVTLKGELFHFGSLKTPPVVIDRSDAIDLQSERDAAVYERIALVETFFQMFDSLLLHFLEDRLSDQWPQTLASITRWISSPDGVSAP